MYLFKKAQSYLDTNRICPQKLSIAGKELSMPDPWLRILEWRTYNNKFASSSSSSVSIEVEVLGKNQETSNKFESNSSSDIEEVMEEKSVNEIRGK